MGGIHKLTKFFFSLIKGVALEIGRYVHDGIVLLADDIQMIQRTTFSPTPFPTFSPTKQSITVKPTKGTNAPTTTNILTCPAIGDPPLIIESGSVMLRVADTSLCTLTKSITSIKTGEVIFFPIARSYENNDWEIAGGEYASTIFSSMREILCYSAGCQINLPTLEPGEEYQLSTFTHSLPRVDEFARFLETATFGITQDELEIFQDSTNGINDEIVDWVSRQMNLSIIPMTSHREYWRHGLNPRVS